MRWTRVLAGALGLSAGLLDARIASAQTAPCSVTPVLVDSARDEVITVLSSGGQVMQELKQELGIKSPDQLRPFQLVRDAATCIRMAPTFGRTLEPGTRFVVLRLGPLYYARDPDQKKATGVLTDSTFKVVARLGVALP